MTDHQRIPTTPSQSDHAAARDNQRIIDTATIRRTMTARRDLDAIAAHAADGRCDVCRLWGVPHPSGCMRPSPIKLTRRDADCGPAWDDTGYCVRHLAVHDPEEYHR